MNDSTAASSRNKVSARIYIYIYIFASSRFRNGPPLADVIKVCRQPLLLRLLSAGDERNAPDAPLFPALPYWMSSNFDRVSL